jgi:hypothetical protein
MAIDDTNVGTEYRVVPGSGSDGSARLILAIVGIAVVLLAVGEMFMVHRMNALRNDISTQQSQMRDDFNGQMRTQVANRLAAMEQENAQQLEAVRTELDGASKRVGAQSGELRRARKLVATLQTQEQAQTDQLKQELDKKANQEQVGALTQDVSSTKTDLTTTQKNVSSLAADLGMARSDMGNLIARNHDDIEYLRKLGERDYFEFTLTKEKPEKVDGVNLTLKKTNLKHYRFTLSTLVDDMQVDRKDCTVNSPVYFYVNGSKKPYELVVNKIEANQVKGYISAAKGVTEVASRNEATHSN